MPEPMTTERLTAIRERAEKATDGPWKRDWYAGVMQPKSRLMTAYRGYNHYLAEYLSESDAVFIAAARTDVPALLDHIETLASEVERLTRWKAGALPVLAGLQDLGVALGLPLGGQITGPEAVTKATELRAEVERLRRDLHTASAEREHALGIARLLRQERNALRREVDDAGRARAALDRVRALHQPVPIYLWESECGHDDDEHELIESDADERLCADSPTGERLCETCHDEGGPVAWPCATIRALDGEDARPS